MKKIIVPRKDHEVYFIPMPEGLKTKQMQVFVMEQLDKLHPAFSADAAVDFEQFVFKNARWLMVTVMEAETYAEYKILNKGAVFYTNTSIAVHKKDFTANGINVTDDERIGYDEEKNVPVSVPLELEKGDGPQNLLSRLKTAPSKHGVFVKKIPTWCIAAVAATVAATIAVVLLSSFAFGFAMNKKVEPQPVLTTIETLVETKYLPSAIEMLAALSADIVAKGGEIVRWNYGEDAEQLMVIQLKGIDALTAHQMCSQYEYAYLQDINNISYNNGEPLITINIKAVDAYHAIPNGGAFPAQSAILAMLNGFTNALVQQKISIVSEVMPTSANGSPYYSITYTANGRQLISSFDTIVDFREKLRVRNMDVSISGDKHTFTVLCSLVYCDAADSANISLGSEKSKIPAAFGYKEYVPPVEPVYVKAPETKPDPPSIGSIKVGGGQVIFFRDPEDGKMKMRVDGE